MTGTRKLDLAKIEPFKISRTFDAPRELVWRAWTEKDHIAKWFGPKGVTLVQCTLDMRPGGSLLSCMRSPDGGEMWGKWQILEVAGPERLVFINSFSNAKGELTRHPMAPVWPLETLTTIRFAAQGARTTVDLEWIPVNATAAEIAEFDAGKWHMTKGWDGTFDQLTDYLATAR